MLPDPEALEATLQAAARASLNEFALGPDPSQLCALPQSGGFSGARLWRVESHAGHYCLKAYPPLGPAPDRLTCIHSWMRKARAHDLMYVPFVFRSRNGSTVSVHAGRPWELATWMPGQADFHARPSIARLEAAAIALARVHAAWSSEASRPGPCPGVLRRLDSFAQWKQLCESGWQLHFGQMGSAALEQTARRGWDLMARLADSVPPDLAPWAVRELPRQPCLCDVWHDHVLFEGDEVSGLIDFASAKIDHVSVDLARLLGSLVPDQPDMWEIGFRAYSRICPLSWEERALAMVLDRTGNLIAVMNWLRWLYHDGRRFADWDAVAGRLRLLVDRIDALHAGPRL